MTRHLATFFFRLESRNPRPSCWNSYMWTSTNSSSPASSVLSPHSPDSLVWGNSTFLRLQCWNPPLSARYREQTLLCFASRLSLRRRRQLSPLPRGGPSNQVVLPVVPAGESLKVTRLRQTQHDWLDGVKQTRAIELPRLLLSSIQKCYSYTCRLPALSWIASR